MEPKKKKDRDKDRGLGQSVEEADLLEPALVDRVRQ